MGQILRVTKAFSVLSDPSGYVYTPGQLVDANHPHVKGREDCFETVEDYVSARAAGGVEEASAPPGGKRTRTRGSRREPEPPHAPVVSDAPEKSPNPTPSKD